MVLDELWTKIKNYDLVCVCVCLFGCGFGKGGKRERERVEGLSFHF